MDYDKDGRFTEKHCWGSSTLGLNLLKEISQR